MLTQLISKHTQALGLLIAAATVAVAIYVWGESVSWRLAGRSIYEIFPLFGLVAFSLFWTQYVMLALAKYAKTKGLARFFKLTGSVGLGVLLLHPSLLVYQLWHDGFGLPPGSYLRHFVPSDLGWVALLGTFSWLIFLTYYLQRFLKRYRWWPWFKYLAQAAMLAVFYHGLRLGGELQSGWFRQLWIVYGMLLVLALAYLNKEQLMRLIHAKQRPGEQP